MRHGHTDANTACIRLTIDQHGEPSDAREQSLLAVPACASATCARQRGELEAFPSFLKTPDLKNDWAHILYEGGALVPNQTTHARAVCSAGSSTLCSAAAGRCCAVALQTGGGRQAFHRDGRLLLRRRRHCRGGCRHCLLRRRRRRRGLSGLRCAPWAVMAPWCRGAGAHSLMVAKIATRPTWARRLCSAPAALGEGGGAGGGWLYTQGAAAAATRARAARWWWWGGGGGTCCSIVSLLALSSILSRRCETTDGAHTAEPAACAARRESGAESAARRPGARRLCTVRPPAASEVLKRMSGAWRRADRGKRRQQGSAQFRALNELLFWSKLRKSSSYGIGKAGR